MIGGPKIGLFIFFSLILLASLLIIFGDRGKLLAFYYDFQNKEAAQIENFMRESGERSALTIFWDNFIEKKDFVWDYIGNGYDKFLNGGLELAAGKVVPLGQNGWQFTKDNLDRIFSKYPSVLEKIKYGTE